MEAGVATATPKKRSVGRRLSDLFYGRERLQVGALLAGPIGWLVIGYLGSLAILLVSAFWQLGELSGKVEQTFTLDNFQTLINDPVYRTITLRTVGIAAAVTATDIILAFPLAFFMAKMARPRTKALLVVAVLLPLWSAYLVKIYAWRTILSGAGPLDWALSPLGLHTPGYGTFAVYLVMAYLWLPYMVIPIYAGLERIPDSVINASDDLGAHPGYTFRRVILPLVLPAVIAGSIFTFSLTLGDYIAPLTVSSTQFIGNVVYANISNNLPLAAAFAMVPIVVMVVYLLIARRLGAFEHL